MLAWAQALYGATVQRMLRSVRVDCRARKRSSGVTYAEKSQHDTQSHLDGGHT